MRYFHLHAGEKFLCLSLHSSRSHRTMNNRIEITEIQVLVQSLNVFSVSFYDIHVAVWTLLTSECCCRRHLCRLPEDSSAAESLSHRAPGMPLSLQTLVPFLKSETLSYQMHTISLFSNTSCLSPSN